MTNLIDLTKTSSVALKPIEFQYVLEDLDFSPPLSKPGEFKNVELIAYATISCKFDVMYAYNNDRSNGVLYLGKWNDGII